MPYTKYRIHIRNSNIRKPKRTLAREKDLKAKLVRINRFSVLNTNIYNQRVSNNATVSILF